MDQISRPLLLADYLTVCYNSGGALAVLALQSLFTLILKHNLDYPRFFVSLYRLCSVEIFSAKYRTTFFSLLSRALQSTNLPAYLAAAFIKRLSFLALHTSSCNARFCVAQITWLLRKHPQCLRLIHRSASSSNSNSNSSGTGLDGFREEDGDLEAAGAMDSSLWELLLLEKHYLGSIAELAAAVRDARSTDNGRDGFHERVEDHLDVSYPPLIEEQLAAIKKKGMQANKVAALAHRPPKRLIADDSVIKSCFGVR